MKKQIILKSDKTIPNFPFNVKAGIFNTIADAIYSTTVDKIKEAVANSMDVEADNFYITLDNNDLSLIDNGAGMDIDDIKEIFNNIGLGLKKPDPKKYSQFGLGLFSVIRLSEITYIYSKKVDKEPVLVEIVTSDVYDDKKDLKDIQIKLIRDKDIIIKYSFLNDIQELFNNGKQYENFTEIMLTGIKTEIKNEIKSSKFLNELSYGLPLPVLEENSLFNLMESGLKNKVKKMIFSNKDYCPNINVFYNDISEENLEKKRENRYKQLFHSFPELSKVEKITNDNFVCQVSGDNEYAYYFLVNIKQISERNADPELSHYGFSLRNKNMLIKESEYFYDVEKNDNMEYIERPFKKWIYGEIFHKNMANSLIVSKKDIKYDNKIIKNIASEILGQFRFWNEVLRTTYETRKKIQDEIVKPLKDLPKTIEKKIKKVEELNKIKTTDFIKNLKNRTNIGLLRQVRKSEDLMQVLKIENEFPFFKIKGEEADIMLANIEKDEIGVDFNRNNKEIKTIFTLSKQLFENTQIKIFGKEYTMKYIYPKREEQKMLPLVAFDIEKGCIYINLFNEKTSEFSINIVDLYILLEIGVTIYAKSEDLREFILNQLGDKSPEVKKFLSTLEEFSYLGSSI